MKHLVVAASVFALATAPAGAFPARRAHFVEAGPPSDTELAHWDLRLRRWLEDRRVATEPERLAAVAETLRPYGELLFGSGRPWEALGTELARARAAKAAWAAFRGGRASHADAIVAAALSKGPATALSVPWDWSDGEAFLPQADAFAARLEKAVRPRCTFSDDGRGERWIDGTPLGPERNVTLGEGVHRFVRYAEGIWRTVPLRCAADGRVVSSEAVRETAVVASDAVPLVVSVWKDDRVHVGWFGTRVALRLTDDAGLDRSVALDRGGGPLVGLRLPPEATVSVGAAAPRRPAVALETQTAADGRGFPSWLWWVLGAAAVGGGAWWLANGENAGRHGTMSVKWE